MRIEDLNWMEVEEYLKHGDRIILVTGACEQHGYLSLLSDIKIPLALADAASKQTGVWWRRRSTLAAALICCISWHPEPAPFHVDGCNGRYRPFGLQAGFPAVLVVNGHGGNNGIKIRLGELANQLGGLHFQLVPLTRRCPTASKRSPSGMRSSRSMPTGWKPSRSPAWAICRRARKSRHVCLRMWWIQNGPGSVRGWFFWRTLSGFGGSHAGNIRRLPGGCAPDA